MRVTYDSGSGPIGFKPAWLILFEERTADERFDRRSSHLEVDQIVEVSHYARPQLVW